MELIERGFIQYLKKMGRGTIRRDSFLSLTYPELSVDWNIVNLAIGDWKKIIVSEFMVSIIYSE